MLGIFLTAFFIGVAYLCDLMAFRGRGTFVAFVFIVVAFGLSIVAIPFITQPDILASYPAYNVITANVPLFCIGANVLTSCGTTNTLIQHPAYNVTSALSKSSQATLVALAYFNALIHFVLIFLMLGAMFWEGKKRREKRMNQ